MSESSWVVSGVDAGMRQRAVEDAERRGLSLEDYLTDVILHAALAEQIMAPQFEADPIAAAAPDFDIPQQETARHRLDTLERRVALALGSLRGSVDAIAARTDEAEILAADTADLLDEALRETASHLAAFGTRLTHTEDQADAIAETQDAMAGAFARRCSTLEERLGAVDDATLAANAAVAQLGVDHDALKYAVADDFAAFARESAARLGAGLDEVRAAADAAAEQAEAAVAHLVHELRSVRETIEARTHASAAETRQRMHAAFADAAERLNALSDRVGDCEALTVRTGEQLRHQLADIEDGAQTALEETAESLRQAGAALAAEFARATQDNRTALESVHADLSAEIADLRDRQAGGHARLKLMDAAVANTIGEVATLREALGVRAANGEAAVRAVFEAAQTDWDARLEDFAARLADAERDAAESRFALQAETERVEACALAALEKLARDRADGDAALARDLADMRDLSNAAIARLALLDRALGAQDLVAGIDAGAAPLDERLAQLEAELSCRTLDRGFDERLLRLEAGAEGGQFEHALAALRGQIGALAAQVDAQQSDDTLAQRVDELRTRVFAYEAQAGEANDRLHGATRLINRLAAQNAEAATQAEDRLHKVERALADMGVEPAASGDAPGGDALHTLEQRLVELEQGQIEALEGLRAEMAAFIAQNLQRLETLESAPQAAGGHDLAADFDALRRRMEDRVLGVEQRSVRALEQVADTMAVLEQRFVGGADLALRSA